MSLHLTALTIKDQFRFHQAIGSTLIGGNTPLAAWSFPAHYIWKDLFSYSWTEVDGWICLFAQYADGIFMPLPPLGPRSGTGSSTVSSLQPIFRYVMEWMDTHNQGRPVTRIENIPAELKEAIQTWGYRLTQKDSDYLYDTSDLIALKGNPYKSQRAAYNRFLKSHRFRLGPYRVLDRDNCLALFQRWVHQKEEIPFAPQSPNEEIARLMLRDSAKAHRVVLNEYRELGLTGRVLWVDGSIRGYTFGYPRSREVFCVLLEVADRSVYGLSHYLFREFCREFQHYSYINTMDDSGLPSLARAKRAYHPCQMVANYIAQPT
ncbi:MAG: DUF2156 domain-containing protein [Nitrospira sp.]|nr:DUF2156 domain-containing protein [Nitrospira sp.]MCA9477367.1 DUF2156 domain-containing protein [Nitrospira sp.]MCA9481447.1 DUF2156 domain-containing protein [Nitrospira sp.]MCB9711534.1 DUF2156 domain-containing protein [Nitrospiraceae bacterium]MDR4487353.1 phosphatidylglycerol lysyltransferase domain-containing protein [Nitrospirales bacterium]